MKIGTNIPASIAANSLAKNERAMAQSMQRLSTGLRINSASDDAAGLAIASRMTSHARGLDQAVQNANDAIGMVQTADGAVASVTDMLQRMRELSVQAASDTNTSKDSSSLDLEYQALKAEIERVFSNTQWNGENLLDGSHFGSTTSLQVGANASQIIDFSLGSASINTLGGTANYGVHPSSAPTLTQVSAPITNVSLNATGTWTQRGSDLDGEAAGDQHGFSVSLSKDGNTLAVGAIYNSSTGTDRGHARVYFWSGSSWMQMGSDIDGLGNYDYNGYSVNLSDDGQTLAVSALQPGGLGSTRIYGWDVSNAQWIAKGTAILGKGAGDRSGSNIKLSADGNMLAIGASWGDSAVGSNSGYVRTFSWNGSAWVQRGTDINGEAAEDYSGVGMSLSNDGNILAIGAPYNDGNGSNSGHVRVYEWNGSSWNRLGNDINGESAGDGLSFLSLSLDGKTLAVGASTAKDGSGNATGHTRVFKWNGSTWVQLGSDIDGDAANDFSGWQVSLNDDGSILTTVAPGHDSNKGHAKIYKWNETSWVQVGNDIDGETAGDGTRSVSSNAYGNTVALGSRYNDGNGTDSGHVRIYDWPSTTTYTAGVSKLDFNHLDLAYGDRIIINVAGGVQVEGFVGASGLDGLLSDIASQLALQTSLYNGANASAGVISITGLADGNAVSGLSVSLERGGHSTADSIESTRLASVASASASLAILDRSIDQISKQRAGFGAVLNRLEYAIDNLATMSTNVKASQSRIQDADYAKETTELARTQIIQQAATAMLAQANQQAKVVMDILNWDK
ncbi:flagellin [Porticoccaceae bacterium]|nr:flagellin [Porticoccaceae bacterium]